MSISYHWGKLLHHTHVSPSDTIWSFKCKLHREYLRRASEREPPEGGAIIPPPDDQKLVILPNYEELSQCEKTVEFYDLHEGSEL
jgi:hypothetical protein